ncbi:DUF2683 family protein [Dyadobacter fanqingshengii]|uniref:Uncharacterized protein n=1 Tax=Dyadobacter fanqingshengii TaxID=2906443 RepID=A0A9X1PEC7_9BACT|nr:DUF2683 family protein [Dyadobacter fanqingshengii]MCF0043451.1 hypothetical protein [Dyadobacter fanqingshengii]USJ35916.1 hypothetical protein NFI81_24930 [Dyadobacter fanqingshengii]
MTTLLIKTEDEAILTAVKNLLKDFQVAFEEREESPYDPEFVKKIKQGRQDILEGKKFYNADFVAMVEEGEKQIKDGRTTELKEGENLWDLVTSK